MPAPVSEFLQHQLLQRFVSVVLIAITAVVAQGAEETIRPAVGNDIPRILDSEISVSWRDVELRTALDRCLTADKRISLILDRRIDPQREVSRDISGTRREVLDSLLSDCDSLGTVFGNVYYAGPKKAVQRIRTLLELRSRDFPAESEPLRKRWFMPQTFRWKQAATPREILEAAAEQSGAKIQNLDLLPHDRWPAASLPQFRLIDLFCLVLNEFDLTWSWQNGGAAVRLERITTAPLLRRVLPIVSGESADAQLARWKSVAPEAEITPRGNEAEVAARFEELEAIVGLKGGSKKGAKTNSGGTDPLSRKRFTLRSEQAAPRDFISKLSAQKDLELKFDFDEATLKAAGVDLDHAVSIDIMDATLDALLNAIFQPVGAEATRKNNEVRIDPAR